MKLKSLSVLLASLLMLSTHSCKDDDDIDVGSNIQPKEDVLTTYSAGVFASTSSVLADTVLSKSDYLFLGQYTDSHFGPTQAEFMTQLDARLEGISLPDTSVVSSSSSSLGILNTMLNSIDTAYGDITKITDAKDLVVDSAFFYIKYEDEFIGDSNAIQAINVYALSETIPSNKRYYTNAKVSDYCDKDTLLGTLAYQVANKRVLQVPIDLDYAKRLAKVYMKGSSIKTQAQFNKVFKGFYVSHSFNEGAVLKVSVAGVIFYYHYTANIHTTYKGKETVVNSADLTTNPLCSSLFLSANKSVERINVIKHPGGTEISNMLSDEDYTYTFTPAGLYSKVKVPYNEIRDSVRAHCNDSSKVSFNSASLKVYVKTIDWSSKLSRNPSAYMMLINKDSISDFFYNDRYPDGLYSIAAAYDTTCKCYPFDLSTAVQTRMTKNESGKYDNVLENMVIVPITITTTDDDYYYYQQLWVTGTRFYSENASDEKLRPRVDIVYTKRE